jgi:hypothetical protein
VVQRALDEIENATGFKAFLLIGGLTPASDGDITTHVFVPPPFFLYYAHVPDYRYTTGTALRTGLTFVESWGGYQDIHGAFVKWLQMAYSKSLKI